jgi:hypothetical protein
MRQTSDQTVDEGVCQMLSKGKIDDTHSLKSNFIPNNSVQMSQYAGRNYYFPATLAILRILGMNLN